MRLRRAVEPRRTPLVGVVVPCYNYGRFLRTCVASLTGQAGVDVRVTVIDDCSSDDSPVVADRLADEDGRVRVIHHAVNKGHIATYNEGLSAVDSDYVVLISADDYLAPGALARAAALMDAVPSVGLVYGHPRNFTDEPPSSPVGRVSWSTWRGSEWIRRQFTRSLNGIYSPEAVVRTAVQHRVGYYEPSLPHSGDLEMWLRIAAVSDVGHVNGPVHAFRRVHGAAMSQNAYAAPFRDIEERVRAYRFFLDHHPDLPRHAQLTQTLARRATDEAVAWALAEARHGRLTADAEADVRAFVRSLDPAVESRAPWLALQRRADERRPGLRAVSWERTLDVAEKVRWRRWRAWGM